MTDIPVGTVISYMGSKNSLDEHWLVCDGRSLSTLDYPKLFEAIGNNYGSSTGYFRLPDLQGMFLRGVDPTGVADPDYASRTSPVPGDTAVVAAGTVGSRQADQLRIHQHEWDKNFGQISSDGDDLNVQLSEGSPTGNDQPGPQATTLLDGGGNETRPSNAYAYFVIYAG